MKLIILDRDGVINQDSDEYIKSPDEWIPIPGSLEAIAKLNHEGYTVTVATNQSGLARGYFDLQTLSAMHRKMEKLLADLGGQIDAVFYCPHGPKDGCECRKPQPGMLHEIAERFQESLDKIIFIGDTINDLKAATAAGVKPVLVRTGKGEKTEQQLDEHGFSQIPVHRDLAAAVDTILSTA
ncbi:MAG: D-glycero-beta-D-manno-heptose 1,7-bisphosphate 7-phosphatase [Gammaproteobacteria bacterium]|nr:D-glycero-beta-D-manno-heptose 1,7-bisphosphate 7-phosphatase [Gammaproteobacteria bacterium]MCW8923363.1 D-glycero-beta-D-manno-heptose 1,7-bisphosphate 7-phosphatase [Gammaproteobacteria bacterium]